MACEDEPGMLSAEQCREKLLASVTPLGAHEAQRMGIVAAAGHIAAQDVVARLDIPPTDNAAMDGYAIHETDLTQGATLAVIGSSFAGRPHVGEVAPGQCVRIMTGGVIPEGAVAVIMQEDTIAAGAAVTTKRTLRAGENIRSRGEDICAGDVLVPAGRRLRAADIGLLASQGFADVHVKRRLRIALISTGDELALPGQALEPGQIYDSNRAMLHAALTQAGFDVVDMGHVADDEQALEMRLREADAGADVVMTSGGVSVGEADYVRRVIGRLGQIRVWRIAIKPGKPFAFGQLSHSVFFGLPGNPVSALVTLHQLAMPALMRMQGSQWQAPLLHGARLSTPLRKQPGRAEYQRAILTRNERGELTVTPLPNQGSGVLTTMSQANCFIVLAREQGSLPADELVMIEPFYGPLLT